MTRAEYKAARRLLRQLSRASLPKITDPGYSWQDANRLHAEVAELRAQVLPRIDYVERRMQARWENRRIRVCRELAERKQREKAERLIAQTDFSGMSPLHAALKRIELTWGTVHA